MALEDIIWNVVRLSIAFAIPFLFAKKLVKLALLRDRKREQFLLDRLPIILVLAGIAVIVAVFFALILGSHYEEISPEDWGYIKDYDVTKEERYFYGLKVFLFLMVAILAGYFKGRLELKREAKQWLKKILECGEPLIARHSKIKSLDELDPEEAVEIKVLRLLIIAKISTIEERRLDRTEDETKRFFSILKWIEEITSSG